MPAEAEARITDVPELLVRTPSTVRSGAPISEAIAVLVERPQSRMAHVVDAEGRLVGTVSFRSLLAATRARLGVKEEGIVPLLRLFRNLLPEKVDDLMRKPTPVQEDAMLKHVLLLMEETKQNDIPVVDAEGRLVGEVNGLQVLALALRVFQATEEDLARERSRSSGP